MTPTDRSRQADELLRSRGFGVLSTISKRLPGHPFGSTVNYAVDRAGQPLFLLSSLAVHTKNFLEDPRVSLTVFAESAEQDPLPAARMCVMGEIGGVPGDEIEAAHEAYFQRHAQSRQYLDFGDFAMYRLQVAGIYYVGGFGAMGWV